MKYSPHLPVALTLVLSSLARADVIHVPADQPTVQSAIDAAVDGDEVVVAPGTYLERIDLRGKTITVRGTNPTDPAVVAATVLDGTGSGSVILCTSGEGAGTLVSGLTITGGSAVEGGGMLVRNADPQVTHCVFTGNVASADGGGIAAFGASDQFAIDACRFEGNTAYRGGGAFLQDSHRMIRDTTFVENSAFDGGGVYSGSGSYLAVEGCSFERNSALGNGGGYAASGGLGVRRIERCVFRDNSANAGRGGGVYFQTYTLSILGSVLTGNSARQGGGVFANFANLALINSTLVANTASESGGAVGAVALSAFAQITNDIFWANGPEQLDLGGGFLLFGVRHSIVEGGYSPGTAILDTDPLFADTDFRLSAGSPCIDAGNTDGVSGFGLATDLDGTPRMIDDITTFDAGVGDPVVDIGAYESHSGGIAIDVRPAGCPNDLNLKSHGVLPVALAGSTDLDVADVDVSSLVLSRADGTPGFVLPSTGPPGPSIAYGDASRPVDGSSGACDPGGADGLTDLLMKFRVQDIVANIDMSDLTIGDTVDLQLDGYLTDGTAFSTWDRVLIVSPLDLNLDSIVSEADLDVLLSRMGELTAPGDRGDLSYNGLIDRADYEAFVAAWRQPAKPKRFAGGL